MTTTCCSKCERINNYPGLPKHGCLNPACECHTKAHTEGWEERYDSLTDPTALPAQLVFYASDSREKMKDFIRAYFLPKTAVREAIEKHMRIEEELAAKSQGEAKTKCIERFSALSVLRAALGL